jgi:DNA-binding SARP family transcriptional activator/streptogramin lyase
MDPARRLHPALSSPRGLRFHVLGRLEVYSDGVEVDLGPRKQRALLALLLLNANRVVSMERLIDDLWGDTPPSTARAALQVHVAGLRKALNDDGATLRTREPGYVLEVEDGALDLDRFTKLRAEAREANGSERRAALLHEALLLWREEPLPELRNEPFSSTAVAELERLRLGALEERIDADLALGRDAELVTELEPLVAEHPYRERLRAQLMLALYRSGRQADALDTYQAGRRALQDELGLEPSKDLRDLEAAILRQDEALSPARPVSAVQPDQPLTTSRLSRRALIAAAGAGFAAVALGSGVAILRSGAASGTRIEPGSVGVVDPVAGQVIAEVPVGFSSPLIAAGEGFVWLVDTKGHTLTRIDPVTNASLSWGIPADGIPIGLAAGEGSVWIALNEGRVLSVLEVGPELGERRGRIPLQRRDALFTVAYEPITLAVGGGAVWALDRGLGQLTRIDPATRTPKQLADGLGGSSSLTVSREAVWLGGPDGVAKLDPRTGQELGRTPVEQVRESRSTSIAVGKDAVWFVGESSRRLWRIHPRSVLIVDSDPVGESPSAVAVDDDGAVWVASSALASLARLQPADAVERIEVGATSRGLVADFGRLWTSAGATPA